MFPTKRLELVRTRRNIRPAFEELNRADCFALMPC